MLPADGTIHPGLTDFFTHHLDQAVSLGWHAVDPKLRGYLAANVQRFSGFRTYAVQQAMRGKLTDEAGNIRSFADFRTDALAINQRYNVDYLRTEYETAIASAQMASKWSDFAPGALLRYDTAGDDHVRHEHAVYDGITRPKDDPFWDGTYPPCDWGCRCTVTEVDDEAVVTPAHKLAGLPDVPEEFRQNVGKTGEIFGPDHPYFDVPKSVARKIDEQLPQAPDELPGNPRAAAEQLLEQVIAGGNPLPKDLKYQVVKTLPDDSAAIFTPTTGAKPPLIRYRVTGEAAVDVATILHEQGHALDNYLRLEDIYAKKPLLFASQQSNTKLSGVMTAIRGSQAHKRLSELMMQTMKQSGKVAEAKLAHLRYLGRAEELFARSFTQYIAARSGQTDLLSNLILHQQGYKGISEQWAPSDFEAIGIAFDQLFKR